MRVHDTPLERAAVMVSTICRSLRARARAARSRRYSSTGRSSAGSRFYWIDPNEIAILIDAEPGAWGPGSAAQPSSRGASAMFALADLARNTVNETWMDARAGEETYRLAQ